MRPGSFHFRRIGGPSLFGSQFGKTAEGSGVLTHRVGDYLFGLESRDRYFGSLIGVRYGEALVADRPLRLAGMGDILALLCCELSVAMRTRIPLHSINA